MPRTRREDRPVTEDLAEVKVDFDELLELVAEWERGQGDERHLQNLADGIQGLLLAVPRKLLETAMKFRSLEQNRMMVRQMDRENERRAPKITTPGPTPSLMNHTTTVTTRNLHQ
jgi:hypothetical protein